MGLVHGFSPSADQPVTGNLWGLVAVGRGRVARSLTDGSRGSVADLATV
jgi:hypothetical protein